VNVVSDQEVFDCPDLYSTQEEADTRMILQALHADKRLKELGKQGRIIIKTSDTDVIVLCIYYRNFFQSGIFLPSMTWNTFVWAVTLVRRSLSADLMEFFPSFLGHTGQIAQLEICITLPVHLEIRKL
jgi:hypothetical protein